MTPIAQVSPQATRANSHREAETPVKLASQGTDASNHPKETKILAVRPSGRPFKSPQPEEFSDPHENYPRPENPVLVQLSPLMVDVTTAAQLLNMGRTVVYDEIRRGRLRSVKRGASRLVPVKALNEYVDLLIREAEMEAA